MIGILHIGKKTVINTFSFIRRIFFSEQTHPFASTFQVTSTYINIQFYHKAHRSYIVHDDLCAHLVNLLHINVIIKLHTSTRRKPHAVKHENVFPQVHMTWPRGTQHFARSGAVQSREKSVIEREVRQKSLFAYTIFSRRIPCESLTLCAFFPHKHLTTSHIKTSPSYNNSPPHNM